jgi:alpha-tubulin suppressor-like RCC1 family protein
MFEEQIAEVSLSDTHTLLLTSFGRIYAWGSNESGQLGSGNYIKRSKPVEITQNFILSNDEFITSIETGNYHNAALSNKGKLFTWGDNSWGELGINSHTNSPFPIDITNNFNLEFEDIVIKISLGSQVSSALTRSGKLFMWGNNVFGEQGNGTDLIELMPNNITQNFNLQPNESITSMFSSGFTSSAITSENRLFMWGYNLMGQFGNGTTINSNIPVEIILGF